MNIKNCNTADLYKVGRILALALVGISVHHFAWAGPVATGTAPQKATRFTNVGSIANTRHNLTQSTANGFAAVSSQMDAFRNDYGAICVYCHTPHAANTTVDAPLWNRTIKVQNYATYDQLGTMMTQSVSTPGPNSLTCLSCHDGQTAIDSILNMPGSGLYDIAQTSSQNLTFLDAWDGTARNHQGLDSSLSSVNIITDSTDFLSGTGNGENVTTTIQGATYNIFQSDALPAPSPSFGGTIALIGCNPGTAPFLAANTCFYTETVLATSSTVEGQGCLTCHSDVGNGPTAGLIVDFRMFNLGTDLTNDHPIGVTFPADSATNPDWNTPDGSQGTSTFFDNDSNGRMAKDEIRTYSGKVECASCHDPHGVPSAGPGSDHNPTFLRVDNSDASSVCLTCHNK